MVKKEETGEYEKGPECMPYVYILRCSDDTFYTGYTVDIKRRLEEHQQGLASKYTRGRTPVELVYLEQKPDKNEAMQREWQIKHMSKAVKQKLIAGQDLNMLKA